MKLSQLAPALAATFALVPVALAAQEDSELLVLYSAGIDGLFVDDKDEGLARAVRMAGERLRELAQDFGAVAFPTAGVQLAYDILTRPVCLRVLAGEAGELRGQLSVVYPDAATARRVAAELDELTGCGGQPLATPFGPFTVAAESSAQRALVRLSLGDPLLESFDLERLELPAEVLPALYASCNGRLLGAVIQPMLARKGSEGEWLWKLLELAGIVGEHAPRITWTIGYGADRALSLARVEGYAQMAKENGNFVEEPLSIQDFKRIPADVTFASLSQVRPASLLQLIDRFGQGAGAGVAGMLRGMTGVDLQQTLEQLGPTAGIYCTRAGGGIMSTVAFIETSDPKAVASALDGLTSVAEDLAQAKAHGRFAVRSWTCGGSACRTWTFPGLPVPLEITTAVLPDAVLLTLTPQAMTAALDQLAGDSFLFDHRPKSLLGLSHFSYLDTPYYLERGYGAASFVSSAVSNALRSPYDPERDPGVLLPSSVVLAQGCKPTVLTSRLEGDDLVTIGSFDRSWTVHGTALAGTPLVRAYAGVAGLGIVSSLAIPNLLHARQAADETAAIATLRNLASAQAQFQATGLADFDRDGSGEYGFMGELAGARPLRGGDGSTLMSPPVLAAAFANLQDDGSGAAVVERSGYFFQVWLPVRGGSGSAEPAQVERTPEVDPELSERYWCAYAWPAAAPGSGKRVFFINQDGDLLQLDNRSGAYGGLRATGGRQPAFDAAYSRRLDMTSDRALNARGRDGNHWTVAN